MNQETRAKCKEFVSSLTFHLQLSGP
jgi:hypothetical protein